MTAYPLQCDEAHPVCESKVFSRSQFCIANLSDEKGCKKGGRDCVYPETPTASKATSKGDGSSRTLQSEGRESPEFSSEESDEEGIAERLEAISDHNEGAHDTYDAGSSSKFTFRRASTSYSNGEQKSAIRKQSDTPSLVQDKAASPTPSTEGSVSYPTHQTVSIFRHGEPSVSSPYDHDTLKSDWSYLPPDLQIYLTYFYENITHLHYSLKADPGDFLKTLFIDAALRNDALLHAVVGFAAFQRTLHSHDGKIQDFLQYYNKAVSLLLSSLQRGDKHSTGTLLTILQLATIEVGFQSFKKMIHCSLA